MCRNKFNFALELLLQKIPAFPQYLYFLFRGGYKCRQLRDIFDNCLDDSAYFLTLQFHLLFFKDSAHDFADTSGYVYFLGEDPEQVVQPWLGYEESAFPRLIEFSQL